jgi:senataxin
VNHHEIEFIEGLLLEIAQVAPSLFKRAGKIGIVSPYKAQVGLIKASLWSLCAELGVKKDNIESVIEVNTVDAYQGREKDIMIMSTVRSWGMGFLADYRRMNVAITRAKHFLLIVGSSEALSKDGVWS